MTNAVRNPKEEKIDVRDLFSVNKKSSETIASTHTSELVIALCGPIGSPLHDVASKLKDMLENTFNYSKCETIRMSELISAYAGKVKKSIPTNSGFDKIQAQIDVGNNLRGTYGAGVLAELAINEIRLAREAEKKKTGAKNHVPRRVCHIIDSIKNQEELDLLRMVYREMLYVVGVFSPLPQREKELKHKKGLDSAQVYQLIDRDSGEESKIGQTVRDTFPQSDFFLRTDSGTDSQLSGRVERFLNLILGTKIITPTLNESAMYAAATAAANSACLSRQVGASVTTSDGEVISTGWNDVPRKNGGLYLADAGDLTGERDKRCWNRGGGKCFNDEEKGLFADQMMETLKPFIVPEKEADARQAISSFKKLRGLIEFSRSIHAEMHAILNAGKFSGARIANGKLFVTTYPCHSCARHIVAAGITEVYYIEPYRKSLAIKLHDDAISENETDMDKVRLLPFDGVAPSRYLDLFKVQPDSRKQAGAMVKISPKEAQPRLKKSMEALPRLEALVVKSLAAHQLIPANLSDESPNGQDDTTPAA